MDISLIDGYDTPRWVADILRPHGARLYRAVDRARSAVYERAVPGLIERGFAPTTDDLKTLLNRMAWQSLEEECAGTEGIRFTAYRQQPLLVYKEVLSLRPKHYNRRGGVSNYPTQHSKDYYTAGLFDGFPPDAVRLDVCYAIDDTGMEIRNLDVVRWQGDPRKSGKLYEVPITSSGIGEPVDYQLPFEAADVG